MFNLIKAVTVDYLATRSAFPCLKCYNTGVTEGVLGYKYKTENELT